jgi:hypothetical protein
VAWCNKKKSSSKPSFLFSRRKLLKTGGGVYFLFSIFSKKVVKTVIFIFILFGYGWRRWGALGLLELFCMKG